MFHFCLTLLNILPHILAHSNIYSDTLYKVIVANIYKNY